MWPSNVKKQKQTQNKNNNNNNTYLPNTLARTHIHASSFTRTHTFKKIIIQIATPADDDHVHVDKESILKKAEILFNQTLYKPSFNKQCPP